MLFILLLIFVTFSIACTAAIFSVYGLAQLFSGSFYAVILMGSALEAGKLISASFLYRYWKILKFPMKSYLISAVFILMVITSIGVFGFLTRSYLQDTSSLNDTQYTLEVLEREHSELITERNKISEIKNKSTENLVNDNNTNNKKWLNKQSKLSESYDQKYSQLTDQIQQKDREILSLKTKMATTQSHVGPIVYVAKAFGASIDDATKYLVLLLITVFDPLAVVLTIGCNIALNEHKNNSLITQNTASEKNITPDSADIQEIHAIDTHDDKDIEQTIDLVDDGIINDDINIHPIENIEPIGLDQMMQTITIAEPTQINDPIEDAADTQNHKVFDLSIEPFQITTVNTPVVLDSIVSEKSARRNIIDHIRKI